MPTSHLWVGLKILMVGFVTKYVDFVFGFVTNISDFMFGFTAKHCIFALH